MGRRRKGPRLHPARGLSRTARVRGRAERGLRLQLLLFACDWPRARPPRRAHARAPPRPSACAARGLAARSRRRSRVPGQPLARREGEAAGPCARGAARAGLFSCFCAAPAAGSGPRQARESLSLPCWAPFSFTRRPGVLLGRGSAANSLHEVLTGLQVDPSVARGI